MIRYAVVVLAMLALAMPVQAAFDMYLRMDPIQGEATDRDHQGWIDVYAFGIGIQQTGGTGSGGASGSVQLTELYLKGPLSKASPKLFEGVVMGRHFDQAVLDIVANVAGTPRLLADWTMDNVLVTSYKTTSGRGTASKDAWKPSGTSGDPRRRRSPSRAPSRTSSS
jgi:type VI secretion system Hcp family effector